jgi:hypothetical protein
VEADWVYYTTDLSNPNVISSERVRPGSLVVLQIPQQTFLTRLKAACAQQEGLVSSLGPIHEKIFVLSTTDEETRSGEVFMGTCIEGEDLDCINGVKELRQDFDRPFQNGPPTILVSTALTLDRDAIMAGSDPYDEVLASYSTTLHSVSSTGFTVRLRRVDQWEINGGSSKSFINWFYVVRVHFLAIKVQALMMWCWND